MSDLTDGPITAEQAARLEEVAQGKTLEELAAEGDPDALLELFPRGLVQGDKRSLVDLFRKGAKNIKLECKIRDVKVDLRDGIPDPEGLHRFAVTCSFDHPVPKPVFKENATGDRVLDGWEVVIVLTPTYTQDLGFGSDAVIAEFRRCLGGDAQAAGRALEQITEEFNRYSGSGERVVA